MPTSRDIRTLSHKASMDTKTARTLQVGKIYTVDTNDEEGWSLRGAKVRVLRQDKGFSGQGFGDVIGEIMHRPQVIADLMNKNNATHPDAWMRTQTMSVRDVWRAYKQGWDDYTPDDFPGIDRFETGYMAEFRSSELR